MLEVKLIHIRNGTPGVKSWMESSYAKDVKKIMNDIRVWVYKDLKNILKQSSTFSVFFFCKTNIDKIKIARYKNEIRIVIKCKYTHCFPINIYPVRSLLWFVGVGTNWFQPCPSGELHWYWGNPFRLFDPNLCWRPNWKTKQKYQNINLLVIKVKLKWLDKSMRSFLLNKHN